jgi:hypothetical protein
MDDIATPAIVAAQRAELLVAPTGSVDDAG